MFSLSDESILHYFARRKVEANVRYRKVGGHLLRWVETYAKPDTASDQLLLWLHGAPGSSRDFFRYLADPELGRQATLLSVDRPGYGRSDSGKPVLSISEQARLLSGVLDAYPQPSCYVIGHSFGGPIAASLALWRPQRVSGVVLVAPVMDPDSEPVFWVSSIGRWPLFRHWLPDALISATEEKLAHREALRAVIPEWRKLRLPIWHWHGRWDVLAPRENIDFCKSQFVQAKLHSRYERWGGHLLPWTHYAKLRAGLSNILESQTTNANEGRSPQRE